MPWRQPDEWSVQQVPHKFGCGPVPPIPPETAVPADRDRRLPPRPEWACCSEPRGPSSVPLSPTETAPTGWSARPATPSGGHPLARGLVLALLLGASLRLFQAARVSLHLDDFHSLFHARNLVRGGFWSELLSDNHPPLSFLVLGAFRALGEDPLLLRLPGVLYGLGTIALTWDLARRLPGRSTAGLAALFVAASSLHVEMTSDLRMYGLLALATLGLLHALVRILEEDTGFLELAIWSVIGLHTHYHFLHALLLLGAAALFFAWREGKGCVRGLLGSWTIAALLSLPWYTLGFPRQLSHGLAPGGSSVSALDALEGFAHLFFFRVSLAPSPVHELLAAAAGLACLLGGLGFLVLVLSRREDLRRLGWLVAAPALLLPLWTALVALLVPRAGYEWRYLAGAIAPFAVLIAAASLRGFARPALWLVLAGATLASLLVVRAPGREDYLGGVRTILAERGPLDPVLAADWQPRLFPHGVGWNFYAPRLDPGGAAIPQLQHTDDFQLTPDTRLDGVERVFCILRSIPDGMPMLKQLRERFPEEKARAFGTSVFVLSFERAP